PDLGGGSEHSGSVPVGKPDEGDEVDFSDHPADPDGSSILKSPAGGGEGTNIDWAAAAVENDPAALGPPGPLSGVRGRGPRPGEKTPRTESTDDLPVPAPRAKPGQADKGKAKLAAKPIEDDNLDEPSVVLDYVAGTSEMSVPGVVKGPGSGKAKPGKAAPVKKKPAEADADALAATRRARPVPAVAGKGGKGWL